MQEGASQVAVIPGLATMVWVLIGIIISLVLPVAVRTLQSVKLEKAEKTLGQRIAAAWIRYGGFKYLRIAIAATVVAVVLVFLLGLEFYTARDAALAGFAWESLINKLSAGSSSPAKCFLVDSAVSPHAQ